MLGKRFSVAVSPFFLSTPFLIQRPFVRYCVTYVMCTVLQTVILVKRSTVVGRFVAVLIFSLVQVAHYPDCGYYVTFYFSLGDSWCTFDECY